MVVGKNCSQYKVRTMNQQKHRSCFTGDKKVNKSYHESHEWLEYGDDQFE